MTKDLLKLWELAEVDLKSLHAKENSFFESVGLILLTPPVNYGYWCTPINTLSFARTGVDGVHFGLLEIDGHYSDTSPVVMTVPASDKPNVIVGENIYHFLALGIRLGYDSLDLLVHDRENILKDLAHHSYSRDYAEVEIRLLQKLEKAFSLKSWNNPEARLAELEKTYFSKLIFSKNVLVEPDGTYSHS